MHLRIRTLALLMFLAGASSGVFAGRAVSWIAPAEPAAALPVDELMNLYRARYPLTDPQASRLRQTLVDYDRRTEELRRQILRTQEGRFRGLREEADAKIGAILEEAGK